MSAYQGRSPQGENMLRTIHFDHPQWTPVLAGFLPAVYAKYGQARMDEMKAAHPRLFPNHTPGGAVIVQDLYVSGRTADCWGCVWDNLHEGMVGQVVEHPLADWAHWDAWYAKRPDPRTDGLLGPRDWPAIRENIEAKKRLGHFSPDHILAHGFHYMLLCDLRRFENFMLDAATGEPMLHKLIDVLMEYNAASVRMLLEEGTEFLGLAEDLGMQDRLPMSLDLWRRFIKPGYACTAGQARDRGLPVFLHCDGHILPIIDDLIETGIRVLNPQIRANGLAGLRDTAKGKVTICIDLDRQLFPFASPEALREHVRTIHDTLSMPEGGLILNIEIGEDVSLDGMHAIFGAAEEVCRLPDPETTNRASIGF